MDSILAHSSAASPPGLGPGEGDGDWETPNSTVSQIKGQTRQSKKIPPWLWWMIAKSLGIQLEAHEKPILSTFIQILTLGSAAGLVFCNMFYKGYDISSIQTPTDIVDGTVSMIMVSLFCGVGAYAHRLAFRLFVHPKFLEKMRLHSKTIMKLNVAVILFLVIAGFIVVQNVAMADLTYGYDPNFQPATPNMTEDTRGINPCQVIQVPIAICRSFYFFQVLFSVFFLIWNVVVGVCLISVARTHTIDIRRFMMELNYDAHLQDQQFRRNFYAPESLESRDTLRQYIWVDNDRIAQALNPAPIAPRPEIQTPETPLDDGTIHDVLDGADALPEDSPNLGEFSRRNVRLHIDGTPHLSGLRGARRLRDGFRPMSEDMGHGPDETAIVPHILPEQEIMHKYWKLATSVRLTSTAFQRWMCCITVMILFWSGIRAVNWLSHTPDFYDIAGFILPLLLLPLLASAYAEVNYEGVKVIQAILPTPERVHMFQYLYGMPIQMTAYGHGISYGTMGTVLAGVMAAFASKVLLQEMNEILK